MKVKENQDGTKEYEGTAQEIAELERLGRGEVKEEKKDKRQILTEEEIEECFKEWERVLRNGKKSNTIGWGFFPYHIKPYEWYTFCLSNNTNDLET